MAAPPAAPTRRASGCAWASDQRAAVAHQLAVGHLVHLAPSLDAPRGDAEPAVRRGQRTRVEAGARGEPVTRSCGSAPVDLEDLDFALDHGHVAGVAQPQPNGSGGGQVPAGGLSVGVATSSASPSQSKDSGTRYGAPSAEALATQTSMS